VTGRDEAVATLDEAALLLAALREAKDRGGG